ncbi:MAG: PAS domain S-box protein, partial [Bacteroidota bacterium]
GKHTFDTVMKIAEKIPVVLVSGLHDEELSLSLIEEGAQDYILKQDLNRNLLSKTIQYALIREKAEEELKASKDFLDKIINSVASPIFVKDDQHRFCLVNDALCSLLNLPVEKLIGTTGYEYFPEEQMKVFIAKDQEVFRTGKENINEEQLTDGTGKIQNIVTRKTLYTDPDGNKFLVGVINDITENRQKENELIIAKEEAEDSRNKFQSIFLFAPTGIGVVKDRVLIKVNQKLLEITGYSEGDLIGQSALILYPSKAEYDYVGKERYQQINETRTGTVETKWRKKDGTIIDVVISSNPIFADNLQNDITFTALDVSSRKLSEAIFKDIIEKNPLSIQILNLDGYTIQTNSAHTRLLALPPLPTIQFLKILNY